MGREPGLTIRNGEGAAVLLRALAQSRAPLRALQGEATAAGRVTLDRVEGYVLDGERVTPEAPFVLQLTQGPTFPFVV